jgi:diacylglycerol kinase family enzyme
MTVRRGRDWGGLGPLPENGVVVATDAELRGLVSEIRRDGAELPPVGLLGGDLCRTLGGRGDSARLRSTEATRVTVDIGSVLMDGRLHWFCAHLVAGTWLWGRVWVAAIAAHHGRWNLAPRAHPGDGLLDVLDATLGIPDRFLAKRRLSAGCHVPHPGIGYRRTAAHQVDFLRPTGIRLDHEKVGFARRVSVRVEAAALRVVV